MIDSLIKGSIGVQTSTTIGSYQVFELVGNGIIGSLYGEIVDMLLYKGAGSRVRSARQKVVLGRDTVKPRALFSIVYRTYLVGTFKQYVFKIMSNTRVRTVFCAGFHHHCAVNLRLSMVFIQPHGKTIRKS